MNFYSFSVWSYIVTGRVDGTVGQKRRRVLNIEDVFLGKFRDVFEFFAFLIWVLYRYWYSGVWVPVPNCIP